MREGRSLQGDSSSSEVTGGIDAFAIGVASVNPDVCLCSVVWNWSAYYTSAVGSVIEGTWTSENYYGGMSEGLVGITDVASFCAEDTQEKVAEASNAILSGSSNVFDGALKTNTGEIIGSEGATLDDASITGGIDWYYENVVVVD